MLFEVKKKKNPLLPIIFFFFSLLLRASRMIHPSTPSPPPFMETPLSRQLQQAWLHTQMRKQHHPHLSPPPPPSAHHSSPSPSPPLPHPPQNLVSEAFRDPVLQYIDDMLKEKGMEDRKCMMQECISYHAAVDDFHDALGAGLNPSSSGDHVFDAPLNSDHSVATCFYPDFGVNDQDFGALLDTVGVRSSPDAEPDLSVHESDASVDLGENAYDWMDELLKDMSYVIPEKKDATLARHSVVKDISNQWSSDSPGTVLSPQQSPDAEPDLSAHGSDASAESDNAYDWMDELFKDMSYVIPEKKDAVSARNSVAKEFSTQWSSDSPGTVLLSPQQSSDSSVQAGCHSPSEDDLSHNWRHIGSVATDKSNVYSDMSADSLPTSSPLHINENGIKESGQHMLKTAFQLNGSKDPVPVTVFGNPISSMVKPVNNVLQSADVGRLKRPATEVETAVEALKSSWNHSMPMPVKGNYNNVDPKTEEIVSYVQNENLNAEICGKVLKHGLSIMVCKLQALSVGTKDENLGVKQQRSIPFTIDLKSLLMKCAQAVATNDIGRAHQILQEIRKHSSPYGNGIQRLAHYFAEGLVARLSHTGGRLYTAFTNNAPSAAKLLKSHHLFVEVCPFVKVTHYIANKAILEAAKGASKIHIIDYGILYGLQWPCLISALAEQKGVLPKLRITGIDFPQPGVKATERVEMTGRRLAEYAKAYGVPFEYHAIADKWENIQPSSLRLKQDEVLIVNSIYRLRHLLDETVLASNPRKTLLNRIRSLNPKIFVQGVKNGSFNTPFFMSRFKESLNYFSCEFDMIDATIGRENQERMLIEREVLGRDILNVVACEGLERIERAETYQQWQNRTCRAGFEQMPLDQNTLREAQNIVKKIYDENFSIAEDGHWMLLRWKAQALYALSLWKPAVSDRH